MARATANSPASAANDQSRFRWRQLKIGAQRRHQLPLNYDSRKIIFKMAEVAIPQELFQAILERIGRM